MNIVKYFWAIRSLVYKLHFKKFGNYSYIGKPTILSGTRNVVIGNRVRIYPGVRIETDKTGGIEIQDNVSIGQNLHLTSFGSELIIGKNTTISGNVLITNTGHNYEKIGVHILDQECVFKETKIGENCFIGYGSVILEGSILGDHCVVGANSVVRGTFPSHSVIAGSPAQIIKKYDPSTGSWIIARKGA